MTELVRGDDRNGGLVDLAEKIRCKLHVVTGRNHHDVGGRCRVGIDRASLASRLDGTVLQRERAGGLAVVPELHGAFRAPRRGPDASDASAGQRLDPRRVEIRGRASSARAERRAEAGRDATDPCIEGRARLEDLGDRLRRDERRTELRLHGGTHDGIDAVEPGLHADGQRIVVGKRGQRGTLRREARGRRPEVLEGRGSPVVRAVVLDERALGERRLRAGAGGIVGRCGARESDRGVGGETKGRDEVKLAHSQFKAPYVPCLR